MKDLKLGMRIFSTLHNKFMIVECVRFLDVGVVWLCDNKKTYAHTINFIEL
jgi:hypothetical protein